MAPEPEPAWTEPDGQLRYAIEAIDGLDESDLACPLCFHLPNRAKRLPCCNATICLTCAKTFLASRLAAEVSKTTSTPDSLESEPRCPFCAQSVVKCIANPTTTNLKFASRNSSSNLLPTLSIKPSVDASGSKKTVHISLTLSDDDVAQTILNDLECHCLYRKAGCQWIGKRSDIDSHLTKSCNLAARAKGPITVDDEANNIISLSYTIPNTNTTVSASSRAEVAFQILWEHYQMNLSRSTAQPVAPRTQHQNQAIIPQAIAPNRLATVDLTGCGSSSPSSTLSAGSAMCLPSLRHSVGSKSLSVTTKQCPTSSVAASPTQQSRSNPSAAVMPSLSAKDMNSTSRTIPIHERSPKVATRSTRSASVVVPATGLSSSSSTPAAIAVVCRRSKSTAVGTTSGYDNTIAVTPRELRSKRSAPELSEAIQAPKRIKHS